ncbi:MAG TPA: XdhC family protein [Ktedonobacterales bacterium]|nr:XdhC family protein [Ktedonobacterales bacterium]
METDILAEVQRLRAERRPFSLATVVAAKQPTSGTPGARAIILAGGEVEGWIGGQCAQPAVVREGLAALADGVPRLVVLRPGATAKPGAQMSAAGVVEVPMLCASEGELQVFVEPFLPRLELVVIGASPAARTLARLGGPLEFEVWACDPEADMEMFPAADRLVPSLEALRPQLSARSMVVVATINAYDEDAAQVALESDAAYVGVVASQKRFAALKGTLRERGISEERLARLQRPKGLPGPALRPGEIAFGVLAALIEARRQHVAAEVSLAATATAAAPRAEAIDPICGMTVDVATARFTAERDGVTYYFCCPACKKQFEAR